MSVRIRYSCPHCSRRIAHHPELAGQLVICSACKGEFYEPTDPLPGKAAEKALKPLPTELRRLRVPVEQDEKERKHDLAILSRSGSSDLRSIEELVEAVLLDSDDPAMKPSSHETPDEIPLPPVKPTNPALLASAPAAPLARPAPPAKAAPSAPKLAGPVTRPLMPPAPNRGPGGGAPMALPVTPKPDTLGDTPLFTPVAPPTPRASEAASSPGGKTANRPAPAPGLAGATAQQMVEELRRRGMGVAMVTCQMPPTRNVELTFSDNMTRDDAVALLRSYLQAMQEPSEKPANRPGILKRLWGGEEQQT